jgi:hypothetical protein
MRNPLQNEFRKSKYVDLFWFNILSEWIKMKNSKDLCNIYAFANEKEIMSYDKI